MFGMLLLALGLTVQGDHPPPMPPEIVSANYSYVDGQRYTFYVSRIDVEQSPRWLDSMDNPPLSARAAIQSARVLMPQIVADGDRWRLGTVSLGQILLPDAWIYNVAFTQPLPVDPAWTKPAPVGSILVGPPGTEPCPADGEPGGDTETNKGWYISV